MRRNLAARLTAVLATDATYPLWGNHAEIESATDQDWGRAKHSYGGPPARRGLHLGAPRCDAALCVSASDEI